MSSANPGRISAILVMALLAVMAAGCGGAKARKEKYIERGLAQLADSNFEKARVEFRNALQIAPSDPEARFENGVVDEKLGNYTEAAQFYQGVIDVAPDHVRARTNLARLYLFAGSTERAAEVAKAALEKHPDDPGILAINAAIRQRQSDMTGAKADAERAVQLGPTNEDAVGTLAGIYMFAGTPEKAQALLEESVKKIPKTIDLRLALAQVYAKRNLTAETEHLLLELVQMQPAVTAHRVRLAQFYSRLNQIDAAEAALREGIKSAPRDHELKLALVSLLDSRRNHDAAEKELKAMIAADPTDFELSFALAKLYETNNRAAQAEAVYREVIEKQEFKDAGLSARDRLAALKIQMNDIPAANKLVNEVLSKSPRDNDALILRGNLELAQEDPKAAIADLRAVLRDQPGSIPVLRTLARAHLANGEPAIAEETMRRARDTSPKDVGVRMDLSDLLIQLGKPDQAAPILADLVKEQPGNVAALDAQFRAAAQTKDFATAKSAAEALVAINPEAAVGYLYEGMLAEEEKNFDAALKLYQTAIDNAPDSVEPLSAAVNMLVNQKRVPDALRKLDEILAQRTDNAVAANLKGELLARQGRQSEAQEAYKVAIQRKPKWWEPYKGLAVAQLATNNAAAAIATIRRGQDAAVQKEPLGIWLAVVFEQLGKPEDSIREYEQLLKVNPRSQLAANNLAMLLSVYKKDSASLDRARSLSARFADSSNPSFLDTYGWVLYRTGDAAASVTVLQRVVLQAPNSAVALYHLGMAQEKTGNHEQARDNLTRAVDSGVKFAGLEEAKATLAQISKELTPSLPKS